MMRPIGGELVKILLKKNCHFLAFPAGGVFAGISEGHKEKEEMLEEESIPRIMSLREIEEIEVEGSAEEEEQVRHKVSE